MVRFVGLLWSVSQFLVVADYGGAYASASAGGVAGGAGGCWAEGAGGCWKRVRLTRKTPTSGFPEGFLGAKALPRRWKTLSCGEGRFQCQEEAAFGTG